MSDGQNVFELARSIDVERSVGPYLQMRRNGSTYDALCPFHADRHLGSFKIYPNGNFKCYSCGAHGDVSTLVGYFTKQKPYAAAVHLCEENFLISHAEAEEMLHGVRQTRNFKIPQTQVKRAETQICEKKPVRHLDKVYRAFASAARPLSEEMIAELRDKRKLSENEMQDFFAFPMKEEVPDFWFRFRDSLRKEFPEVSLKEQDELFKGVPGFFWSRSSEKELGKPLFMLSKIPCIGILTHDRNGLVSGIQLRRMGPIVDKKSRYVFFSSGFADGTHENGSCWGTGCGYPEDVFMSNRPTGVIAITEGHFKAMTLNKMGVHVVNMHGISNFNASSQTAKDLAMRIRSERPDAQIKYMLVYDMEQNPAVISAAKRMCDALGTQADIYFSVWDPAFGKGIDDVVNSGHKSELTTVTREKFFENYPEVANNRMPVCV